MKYYLIATVCYRIYKFPAKTVLCGIMALTNEGLEPVEYISFYKNHLLKYKSSSVSI